MRVCLLVMRGMLCEAFATRIITRDVSNARLDNAITRDRGVCHARCLSLEDAMRGL